MGRFLVPRWSTAEGFGSGQVHQRSACSSTSPAAFAACAVAGTFVAAETFAVVAAVGTFAVAVAFAAAGNASAAAHPVAACTLAAFVVVADERRGAYAAHHFGD